MDILTKFPPIDIGTAWGGMVWPPKPPICVLKDQDFLESLSCSTTPSELRENIAEHMQTYLP